MTETFKNLVDFPNYEISNLGNIRNVKTKRILKQSFDKSTGYYIISLYVGRVKFTKKVHRLVALNHINNPYNFEAVDHIDRDRTNNHASNLRWVTNDENLLNRLYDKTLIYYCNLLCKFVVQSVNEYKDYYYYDTIDEAFDKFKSLV